MASPKGSILITGPNGGIGVGFVSQFLKSPYALTHSAIYAVRDPAKATDLKAALTKAPKDHKYLLLPIDLTSQSSIRSFASDINSRISSGSIPPISALILNAGVQDTAREYFTADGFERTFFVNYLSNFLLTLLLLQSMDKQHGRVIYTGSTSTDIWWSVNNANFSNEEQKKTLMTSCENMARGVEEFPDGDVTKTGGRRYALSKILMEAWMWVSLSFLPPSLPPFPLLLLGRMRSWLVIQSVIDFGIDANQVRTPTPHQQRPLPLRHLHPRPRPRLDRCHRPSSQRRHNRQDRIQLHQVPRALRLDLLLQPDAAHA